MVTLERIPQYFYLSEGQAHGRQHDRAHHQDFAPKAVALPAEQLS